MAQRPFPVEAGSGLSFMRLLGLVLQPGGIVWS